MRPGSICDHLLCRDLKSRAYSYAAAVDYWRLHGQPGAMDADANGIPCETVYPRADVASFWGLQGVRPSATGLPGGLLCKDLATRGASYSQAVAYWYSQGAPSRMDVDGNGIPCETVYPAAAISSFWFGGRR